MEPVFLIRIYLLDKGLLFIVVSLLRSSLAFTVSCDFRTIQVSNYFVIEIRVFPYYNPPFVRPRSNSTNITLNKIVNYYRCYFCDKFIMFHVSRLMS